MLDQCKTLVVFWSSLLALPFSFTTFICCDLLYINLWTWDTLQPTSYVLGSKMFIQEKHNKCWSGEENKKYESALAIYDKDTPDRWPKVAALIPGKTVLDLINRYIKLEEDVRDIEPGRITVPGYLSSSFSLDLAGNYASRKKSLVVGSSDNERKKEVPWTEDEHRRFRIRFLKYGKGDWRNISREFVITEASTQVGSHAQKYLVRQLPGGKDKNRPSIHNPPSLNQSGNLPPLENFLGNIKEYSVGVYLQILHS